MTNWRLYIDGNDDLWVFFEHENFPYIDGPFLYCFENFNFKKQIRLFTSAGRQLIDFSPLFTGQDSKGNFILGSDLGNLAKVSQTGRQMFHKVLMEHRFGRKERTHPYFVKNVEKEWWRQE